MEQCEQIELLRRAAARIRGGTTDAAPAPSRFRPNMYVDEQQLRAERASLFSQFPLLVGFSAQLANAGDYVTHEASGVPILVCRQEDGTLKAFLNVCRHRGTRLVSQKTGHTDKLFVCRYHAWSYDTGGRLRGLPCAHQFSGLDKERTGLLALPVDERAGLVFVVPKGRSCELDRYFGDYARQLSGFGLEEWELYASKTLHGKINWKMMIEANQESYHIDVLHRDTAGPRFRAQLSLSDEHGPHTRTLLLHKHFSEGAISGDPATWRVLDHADLVYFLFPNTLILLSAESAHVLTAFPQSTDRCVVLGATLVPRGTRNSFPRPYYEKYWATILEDVSVSEPIQASAEACPDLELWLGGNENLIGHFHDAVKRATQGELTPPPS